jgi:hypothetical protein
VGWLLSRGPHADRVVDRMKNFLAWLIKAPEKYMIFAIVFGVIGLLWWVASWFVSHLTVFGALILGIVLVWLIAFMVYVNRNVP